MCSEMEFKVLKKNWSRISLIFLSLHPTPSSQVGQNFHDTARKLPKEDGARLAFKICHMLDKITNATRWFCCSF